MKAIGYIRQSRRADLDVALSPEQQRTDILRLAANDALAADEVTIFSDLGRSGGQGKERLRSGYRQVIEAIEAGGVHTVYAKALTRLARSVTELYRVLRIAQQQGTKIHTAKEGVMDPSTPIGKAQFGMLAVFAEFERDLAVERARDNVAARRARGERMGRAPYGERPGEDAAVVVRAFERSRSLNGTARWLNEQLIPSPLGRLWSGSGVRGVLQLHAAHLLPRRTTHGVKPSSPFVLYRLLRCPCGRLLTASRDGRNNREPVYRCHAADADPAHQRPYRVRESQVMPWIRSEAGRLHTPDQVAVVAADAAQREALLAQRERLGLAFTDGLLTREAAKAKADAIDAALSRLDDIEAVIDIPTIDWDWEPQALNAVLHALFESIELGPDMLPVRAVWRVPAWRA